MTSCIWRGRKSRTAGQWEVSGSEAVPHHLQRVHSQCPRMPTPCERPSHCCHTERCPRCCHSATVRMSLTKTGAPPPLLSLRPPAGVCNVLVPIEIAVWLAWCNPSLASCLSCQIQSLGRQSKSPEVHERNDTQGH